MSAVVKTITPFINKGILCEALDQLGVKYTVNGSTIITERVDYYNNQIFIYINGRYLLQHDSSADIVNYQWRKMNFKQWETVSQFLEAVEIIYNSTYQKRLAELERLRLEEEKIKLEQERKEFIEKQKTSIIDKAKERGYSVREENIKGKIKLVLVRNTY